MTLSCIAAHPGHGDYHPEEVVTPSESSSSPAPVQSDSSSGSSSSGSSSSQSGSSSGSSSQASSSSSSSFSQGSSSGGSSNGGSATDGYSSSQQSSSGKTSEVVLNETTNNTNENGVNGTLKESNQDSSIFTLTNIVLLIVAFIIGFAAMVILHKLKVI